MFLLAAATTALASSPPYVTFSDEAMATRVVVTLPADERARDHAAAVFEVFHDVEARVSEWRDGSAIAAVNRAAGGATVPVDPDTLALVQRGVEIGRRTGCAFDVTWAALWGVWDFKGPPRLPEPAEIAARLPLVDCTRVEVDPEHGTVRLPIPGMKLGLGGIAKGWALDRAAATLRARGVEDFNLLAGGQVLAGGHHGDRPWRVGIRDPRGGPEDWFAVVEASDLSVSTSGDYERYFELDGVRYHHILDPRTGWPARGLRSVTVVSADATLADALSTAIFVLGPDEGLALAAGWDGVEALLVDDEGRVLQTPGLRVQLVRPPLP